MCQRAKWDPFQSFEGLLPESQGQNLALIGLYVPDLGDPLRVLVRECQSGREAFGHWRCPPPTLVRIPGHTDVVGNYNVW